jgi:hypothetical protein
MNNFSTCKELFDINNLQYGISKSMFVLECKENSTMSHLRIKSKFLLDLNRGVVKNECE